MDLRRHHRAGAPRDIDRLHDRARGLAREIALRHPQALALACQRAGGADGAALAWAWIDMIRDGAIGLPATPLFEIVALLGVRPDETRGPLRRRLSQLVDLVEQIADAAFSAEGARDAQEAA